MTLLLVRDGAREVWVAAHIGDDLYVYDPHTGAFHRNDALWRDFYAMHSRELIYEAIDPPTALAKIAAGVGGYDGRAVRSLLAEHRADPAPLAAADVLGGPPDPDRPSPRRRAQALASLVADTEPGVWVTWRSYPPGKQSAAYVAASALRLGHVKALNSAGPVESRVVGADDGYAVEVTRRPR